MLEIELITGSLKVKPCNNLETLISYGSRINKKRGFFFISKVTGKHLPVKPTSIELIYKNIATLVPKTEDYTLFIGLAEAATALGQGVFEKYNSKHSFYMQTTRYKTSKDILLSFQEEHSHAPSHILYYPRDENLKNKLNIIKRIVLVDDEVSTGKTAYNLIDKLKEIFPNVKKYSVVSLVNWSKNKYSDIEFKSLCNGHFEFRSNGIDIQNNIKSISDNSNNLDNIIPYNFGRYGTQKKEYDFNKIIDINNLKNKKVLVLGTSEFMYVPYLLALFLENNHIQTHYQGTTRSPINLEGNITHILKFKDNYSENIDNFLYNVLDKDYDKIIVCYETISNPSNFKLKEYLEVKFEVEEIFFKENNV
jgi:hypoxanthine-guanine phosphoribosyltransferase